MIINPVNLCMRMRLLVTGCLLMISGVLPAQNSDSLRQVIKAMHFELPQLSPIPHKVEGVKKAVFTLNGTWKFNPGAGGNAGSGKIEVPGEWEMQGYKLKQGGSATYQRTFTIPADWMGKKIKLRFDGISSHGIVKINGKAIGEHEGSFVAFEFDIEDAIKPGENNLEVEVQCETVSDHLACTSQYAAHPVGGILRKVTLFVLPVAHIADFAWQVKFDSIYRDAWLNVNASVVLSEKTGTKSQLRFTITNVNNQEIRLERKNFEIPVKSGRSDVNSSLVVKSPMKWDPEHPHLYRLTTELIIDGKVIQTNTQRIGFRQLELRGNRFFVNNHPIKLRGVNRHEVHPLRGRSLTPELCRRDVELFRAGNCNYIRTSHYPPSEEFLQACDELGMFVESESSLCWIDHGASPIWKNWDYLNTGFLKYMVNANLENVLSGRQHPSIILWSLGNESRWSPLWERVLAEVKKLDSSRPTSFHDQCWGDYNNAKSTADLANYHYPELNGPRESTKDKTRPTFFGEYMHVQCYARRELETDPSVRSDAYANTLKQMVDSVYSYPSCMGGAIWSGVDDIFHLSADQICGYGPWGPIDGWRREKPEYFGMKKSYAPVIISNLERVKAVNGKLHLEIENRYNFFNLNELKIVGQIGERVFPVHVNIGPLAKGSAEIDLKGSKQNGKLILTFTDPRGFICQQEVIETGQSDKPAGSKIKVNPILKEENNYFMINSGNALYKIGKTDGSLSCTLKGETQFSDGGTMLLVPFNEDDGGAPDVAANNYTQNIQPLDIQPDKEFKITSVSALQNTGEAVRVSLTGVIGNKIKGSQEYIFNPDGTVMMSYDYEAMADFTGKNLLRQFGLLFTLPRSFDQLSWERKGLWTTYPANDINRLKGTAKAMARNVKYVEVPREVPKGEWKDNSNKLGTNDFRSTKDHILSASLTDEKNQGIVVKSDGSQNARSWVDGEKVRFFVAGLNGPGSCRFFTGPRPEFKKGEHLKGTFILGLK